MHAHVYACVYTNVMSYRESESGPTRDTLVPIHRHIAYSNKKFDEFKQKHPEAYDENHPNFDKRNKFFIKKNNNII